MERLITETKKWLEKIEKERIKVKAKKGKEDFLKNIDAYISDSKHFLDNNQSIEAFEAVIWAWAMLELGLDNKFLDKK